MICANPDCGKEFKPKNSQQRFCSPDCYHASYHRKLTAITRLCANPNCKKEFKPKSYNQRFCSRKCQDICYYPVQLAKQREYRKNTTSTFSKPKPAQEDKPKPKPKKSLEQWLAEAQACNLDYGTYRALINAGKSFDELKAIADSRQTSIHSHCCINHR